MSNLKSKQVDLAPRSRPAVLLSGDCVSLEHWLEVSWFYPDGFKKERIVETSRCFIVVGRDVVYKFYKMSALPGEARVMSFADRWKLACQEMLDNLELAPDLYLGIRLLRWIDEEPHWFTELRSQSLDPLKPPEEADEAVLVMRRICDSARLSSVVESEEDLAAGVFDGIVAQLEKFHEKRSRRAATRFRASPDQLVEEAGEALVERLRGFIKVYGSFLDPFSQIALQETRRYLEKVSQEQRELFFVRGNAGFLTELHGSFEPYSIITKPLQRSGRSISVCGRRRTNDSKIMGDVLYDVASFVVDCEARGQRHLGLEFERRYFTRRESAFEPELYQFYLTACAAARAVELLRGIGKDSSVQATSFLALALRYSLGLRGPFLIGVGGLLDEGGRDLARGVCELTSAQQVSEEDAHGAFTLLNGLDDLIFEKLLRITQRKLHEGSSVVLVWPFSREEERTSVMRVARENRVPYLLVKSDLGAAERVHYQLNQTPKDFAQEKLRRRRSSFLREKGPWPDEGLLGEINQLLVEPVLAQPESAFLVLKELVRVKHRTKTQ